MTNFSSTSPHSIQFHDCISLAQYRNIYEGSFVVCITKSGTLDLNSHTTNRIQLHQFHQALQLLLNFLFIFFKTSNPGRQTTRSLSFSERKTSASLQILSQWCFNIYFKIQVQQQEAVFCFGLKRQRSHLPFLQVFPFIRKGIGAHVQLPFSF